MTSSPPDGLDGYQYADMPDDRETWALVLRGLDEVARGRYGKNGFAAAEPATRDAIVDAFSHTELSGGAWDQPLSHPRRAQRATSLSGDPGRTIDHRAQQLRLR